MFWCFTLAVSSLCFCVFCVSCCKFPWLCLFPYLLAESLWKRVESCASCVDYAVVKLCIVGYIWSPFLLIFSNLGVDCNRVVCFLYR